MPGGFRTRWRESAFPRRTEKWGLELHRQLSSFSFDFVVRMKLTGLNLNFFVIGEAPLRATITNDKMLIITASLCFSSPLFSIERIRLHSLLLHSMHAENFIWALTDHERVRNRAILDAVTISDAGLSKPDVAHMMSGCDLADYNLSELNLKGFWRAEKELRPELRHTILTLIAHHDLESKIQAANGDRQKGIEIFLDQNHGEGWMLPETLRLTDYGLGHDDRAQHPQPRRQPTWSTVFTTGSWFRLPTSRGANATCTLGTSSAPTAMRRSQSIETTDQVTNGQRCPKSPSHAQPNP